MQASSFNKEKVLVWALSEYQKHFPEVPVTPLITTQWQLTIAAHTQLTTGHCTMMNHWARCCAGRSKASDWGLVFSCQWSSTLGIFCSWWPLAPSWGLYMVFKFLSAFLWEVPLGYNFKHINRSISAIMIIRICNKYWLKIANSKKKCRKKYRN